MKNEASVLLRMLESVNPMIDKCVCVDTGSTDESKSIVKKFFEEKGKSCKIYDHPFVNFSDARNFALSKLKGKDDYGFWMDCDEQLIRQPDFNLDDLKEKLSKYDLHTSIVISGELEFARRNFFKIKNNFKWVGAVHEILLCDDNITVGDLTDVKTFVNQDGNSWSEGEQKKYLKHAEILEIEVAKTNEPRDIFYLAQSYKDGGETEKAIEWYRKRVERTDGFNEERYYSQFVIGILYEKLNKPFQETVFEYMKCSELDNLRAEHILNYLIIFYNNGLYEYAYNLSEAAVKNYHGKNPYPNRLLFIDEPTYSSKILNIHEELKSRILELKTTT